MDFVLAGDGEFGSVRLSAEVAAEMERVKHSKLEDDKRTRRHIERYFKEYCQEKMHRFNREQFKKQGDFPDGAGGKVSIVAFKCFQWRLYGIELHFNGKRCFIGLHVDPKKQQDNADANALRRAAKQAGELAEYLELKGRQR